VNDVAAVRALILEYAAAIDRGDLDGLADLFADGVLRSPRGEARGRDAVRRWYQDVVLDDDGLPGTLHHVFGSDVVVAGDTARATSFVTVIQHGRPIIAGRYDDRFVRSDDSWHFAERTVAMDLVGDLSRHFRIVDGPTRAELR
jgi:ketosteroid isomerase-like protein